MKKLTTMVFFLVMFLASNVHAGNYTVKKGDYLDKIAKQFGTTWPKLWKANPDIKDPHRIFPRQVLTIPETPSKKEAPAKTATAVAKKETLFYWEEIKPVTLTFNGREYEQIIPQVENFRSWSRYGQNPYGRKQDPKIAINKSNLPNEVKNEFAIKLNLQKNETSINQHLNKVKYD